VHSITETNQLDKSEHHDAVYFNTCLK